MAKSGWEFRDNSALVAQTLIANVREAVGETAFDLVEAAQEKAPVDTGALRASIHAVLMDASFYTAAVGAARVLGKEKVKNKIAPPVDVKPQNAGEICAAVDVAVGYAWFLEYGAFNVRANRQMPAQPFLMPAIVATRPKFERRLQRALGLKIARTSSAAPELSEADQRDAYYRSEYAAARRETNEWKASQMDDMRGRISESEFTRQKGAVKGMRGGKAVRFHETFGEMWERLRRDYEGRRNFD